MPRIGYARVSSSSQDLEIQKVRLSAAGCEVIRTETGSALTRPDADNGQSEPSVQE